MDTDSGYYDIVLFGKTNQGRTSLAMKLLNRESTDNDGPSIDLASGEQELPGECKTMYNEETRIRVFDMPGFAVSGAGDIISVDQKMIHCIEEVQVDPPLAARRVVYFLPVRGALEKADGRMQEELQLLYSCFGKEVFDCMVVVATHQRKHQKLRFDEKDFDNTKRILSTALKVAIEKEVIECPPIKYIGLNDNPEEILKKIQGAKVLKEGRFALKIILPAPPDPKESDFVVVEVKCHPSIVPKYSTPIKILGGVGHLVTLGVPLVFGYATGYPTWPGFTNSDQICGECNEPPDADGCMVKTEESV